MNPVRFEHEAMATTFELFLDGHPPDYARQAAGAAFRELDRLEGELSRYVESSDIARANRLAPGETIAIGEDTLHCLLLAGEVSAATQRTFDPAYASVPLTDAPPGAPLYQLDPSAHTLTSLAGRLHLDLGAVGKGYALDRLAATLREWDVTAALLQSGGSSALALAAPPGEAGWAVGLGEGESYRTLSLVDAALSGSGIAVKGTHLVDPRTGAPAARRQRVWALAANAAASDALSTAFFVMTADEITSFCATHPTIGAAWQPPEGALLIRGAWPALRP
ncbi:Thiamine biosynthesis lipoprotein ApbE precursor [Lacunisphaera limnophila]|uniref:FAD:protein FMN transferase n=1 Tax=Lacunisphaera limnophila TaxID=1838286 RepID=A0A1D8AZ94_9BACT|nr:FAD:protein FMN transferase [Lacunisphaera limnophila]AOS46197.1 Thiamine biosynthesis lipoprotein ApbE precursor [Lacunisphaera limnophila]